MTVADLADLADLALNHSSAGPSHPGLKLPQGVNEDTQVWVLGGLL